MVPILFWKVFEQQKAGDLFCQRSCMMNVEYSAFTTEIT